MTTTHKTPDVSMSVTPGTPPAESSHSAGNSLFSPDALIKQIVSAVRKEMAEQRGGFRNQEQAAAFFGFSGEWLRQRAKEHDLFKPSVGETKGKAIARYHIIHLQYIARHLMDPEIFSADTAFQTLKDERHKWIGDKLEATKPDRKNRSRK